MPSYGASIKLDTASPLAKRALKAASQRGWLPRIGETLTRAVKDNFAAQDVAALGRVGQTNAAGYPKLGHSNLYEQIGRSTFWRVGTDSVTVVINHAAFRQRLQGGQIRPTNGRKYLTIPAVKGAYDRRAREVDGLKFGYAFDPISGYDRPALIKGREKKRKGRVWYWLVRGVNQKPDPSVLPTESDMIASVKSSMKEWMEDIR